MLFRSILSDEAAELAGGLGMAGSVNAGDDVAVAQAIHGSAPDIAGQNIANPLALMRSCAMLFAWLGAHKGQNQLARAGEVLDTAIETVIGDDAVRTPDQGGRATTTEVGQAVSTLIERSQR